MGSRSRTWSSSRARWWSGSLTLQTSFLFGMLRYMSFPPLSLSLFLSLFLILFLLFFLVHLLSPLQTLQKCNRFQLHEANCAQSMTVLNDCVWMAVGRDIIAVNIKVLPSFLLSFYFLSFLLTFACFVFSACLLSSYSLLLQTLARTELQLAHNARISCIVAVPQTNQVCLSFLYSSIRCDMFSFRLLSLLLLFLYFLPNW